MGLKGPAGGASLEASSETVEGPNGAAGQPVPESGSTATMPPADGDSDDSSELDDWEWIRHHDVEVLWMPPRDSARPEEWRARREALERALNSETESASSVAAADASASSQNKQTVPKVLSGPEGQLELNERTALMFKVDSDGPCASGRLPAARSMTKEMIHCGWNAAFVCCVALSESLRKHRYGEQGGHKALPEPPRHRHHDRQVWG